MFKFIKDTFLNMISNFFVIFTLQLILYPLINRSIGQEEFGLFLSIIALVNLYSITIGSAFSNLYLKHYSYYKESNVEKVSYILHVKYLNTVNLICLVLLYLILLLIGLNYILSLIIVIICFLMTNRMFAIVWYRVKINYKRIFVINFFLGILYCTFSLFNYSSIFQVFLILLSIEVINLILIITLIKIDLNKLVISGEEKFNAKLKKAEIFYLILSNIFNNSMNYMDRWLITFLLNPLLVPIYYASTLTIKIFNQPLNVLSNVIFSYVANMKYVNKKNKILLLIIGPAFSGITFILGITVGPLVINKIYPSYFNNAIDVYWIINLALSLLVMDYIFRGYLMKFYPLKYKTIIDFVNIVLFLILSILLTIYHGNLFGIAHAQLVSYIGKNAIQYILIMKLPPEKSG